ncbi:GSCOCT00004199001.3-RA-CDS [Cotesia congregata]|uniref:Odorant receptor n=1 Tax=Cotesia congregata TaxID=51543 RepID=A0A8J2HQQ0_COTCN|nr:GSCOCT00004199001.3-RA-CDS [Cotesia congregata]CAG5109158.1 olfactory receptor 102 [Cotesia congregata]
MIAEKLEYVQFQNIIVRLLSIVGLWTKQNSSLLSRLRIHIYLTFLVVPTFGTINYLVANISNINLAINSLCSLLAFSTVIIKGMSFIINRKDVDELHTILDPYFYELMKNPEMSKQVLNKISTFRRLPKLITAMLMTGSISYAIGPIVSIIHQIRHKLYPIDFNFIYLTLYPWEIPRNSLIHFLHFINEYLSTSTIVLISPAVDSLYTYYMFQTIGILREMSYRISMFDEKNCDFEIRECVNKYEILVRCMKKIQKVYGAIILWTMNTNAIVLCIVMYQLSHAKSIPFFALSLCVAYVCLKLTQVFIYAWSGSLLTTESERFRETIYASRWLGNTRLKASIIIMLCQRPLILTVYNLLYVTIDMFMKVVNTTISYYLLLKTFEQGA